MADLLISFMSCFPSFLVLHRFPADYFLYFAYFLIFRIKAKPIRTASGIVVVAVMSKPHRCPHLAMTGNVCVYCPGGPDSDFEYSTQVPFVYFKV